MNLVMPAGFAQALQRARRFSPWLCLAAGFALFPFTIVQTMIPLAAWLAPILLLRFVRTVRQGGLGIAMVFLAQTLGIALAMRGSGLDLTSLLFWLVMIQLPVLRGLVYTLPYVADRVIGRRTGETARMFVFPTAWVAADWLAGLLPLTNTSGSAVYSQYDSLILMQLVSITGMWGVTFLIGWGASTINALWEHHFDCRPMRGLVSGFVAVAVAVGLYGGIRLNFAPPSAPAVLAATVTLDRATHDKAIAPPFNWVTFYRANESERAAVRPQLMATADQMLARSETALRAGAKIVGWQEEAAMILDEDKPQVLARAAELARQYDAYIQVSLGVVSRSAERHYFLDESILIGPLGKVAWTYEKTYPVVPTESYITPFGPGRLAFADTPSGRLATAICNDFHFQALIRQAGENDADIMMAPYNSLTPWDQQDTVVAIMRAVENGYSMVRATGNGLSIITDYQGRILGAQNYGEGGGVMVASLPTRGVVTIYSRIGDSFAYLCAAGLILLAGRAFIRLRPIAAMRPGRR